MRVKAQMTLPKMRLFLSLTASRPPVLNLTTLVPGNKIPQSFGPRLVVALAAQGLNFLGLVWSLQSFSLLFDDARLRIRGFTKRVLPEHSSAEYGYDVLYGVG